MSHLGLNILSAIQGMPAIWHIRYWEVSLYLFYAADKPLCRGHNFPNKKYQQAPKGRFLVLFLHHYLCIKIIKYQHWKLTNTQFLYFMTDYYLHIITDNPENLMEFDFRFCHWIIGNKQHLWLLIGFWNSRLQYNDSDLFKVFDKNNVWNQCMTGFYIKCNTGMKCVKQGF